MPEKALTKATSQIPVGRVGHPDEVARVVHFLAADASSSSPAKCGESRASSTCDPRPNHPSGGQGFEPNGRRCYPIDEDSGLAGVGLRGCDIDARPAGFGHGVTHSAGARRRFHTDHGIRLGRLPLQLLF